MLSDHIFGTGLTRSDVFRSANSGHATPYQASLKLSMDGGFLNANGSNPIMDSAKNDLPTNLKDINDTPKRKIKPILTDKGKYVVAGLILIGVAYLIWQNHKANKANPTAQPVAQSAGEGGAIAEPPKPAEQPKIVDNSPSVAAINTNPE